MTRDQYHAILPQHAPDWCKALMHSAEKAGAWTTGIESDKRQRGSAINCDLYGYDESQNLAVVQVREAVFHPNRHTRVRKDYYLLGTTETGATFAHPVPSPARSPKALATPQATVLWVLGKIWACRPEDVHEIERQGDVAFVPVSRIPRDAVAINGPITIRDTHKLTGDSYRTPDGTIYTRRGARLTHTKRQHAPVRAKAGLYRVQPGIRETTWGFTAPKGD